MKSKTNIFLLISTLIALSITAWLYYLSENKVGDLAENRKIDGDFRVCNEDRIIQYYSMNTEYRGGKKAIRKKILQDLQVLNFKNEGLITYRFVVNCKGEAGRFRSIATDLDNGNINIDPKKLKKINEALYQLKDWIPAQNEKNSFDSYYVLNFKIRNGQIMDIF